MANQGYRNYNYQYGTEAPKYPNMPYQNPYGEETPNEAPLRRHKQTPKPKRDLAFTLQLTACSFLVFTAAFSFVHLCATLSVKQNELKQVSTQIRETQSSINSVKAIIAANLDLEHIQNVATTQLQMSEPLPHQVVYIELPEQSYTIYNEDN